MYQNFDKVTLLYEGRQIYFGPIGEAADYFVRLGFVRPSRATTADFLTSLTHPAERIVRGGFESRAPRTPAEFAEAWRISEEARAIQAHIADFYREHRPWPSVRWSVVPACGNPKRLAARFKAKIPRCVEADRRSPARNTN